MSDHQNLDALIAQIDTPDGRARARAEIWKHGGPIYDTDPKFPGMIVEHHIDGSFRLGKMIGGIFVHQPESKPGQA